MYYCAKKNTFQTNVEIHSYRLQSPKVHKIALSDYCPLSFLSFCCDGCLLVLFFSFKRSVSFQQEGWRVCAADPDTKGELVRELGLSSIHSDLWPFQSVSGSLSPFSIFSMWYTQPLFKKTKGCLRPFRDPQSEHFQAPVSTLLKCPWARCWLTPSLQSHWSWPLPSLDEGKWKDKFPTCINPSSGKPIWLNCPFKFESCYVSGWNQQPSVSAQSVHLLLAFSRTCLAPACFASITIYKATIKVEGSPLVKRPECVKQQCSAEDDCVDTCGVNFGLDYVLRQTLPKLITHLFGGVW